MKLLYPALSIVAAMAAANELQSDVPKQLRANKGGKKNAPAPEPVETQTTVDDVPFGPTSRDPNVDMPLTTVL